MGGIGPTVPVGELALESAAAVSLALVPRTGTWQMSVDLARRVSLGAQGFADRAPSGAVDRRHLRRVMGRMQVLQLDSIPVVIRTQYLPFHSRLGPYRPDLLDSVAYRHDEWFECWAHEASLLPVGSEPLFRWTKERARSGGTWKRLAEFAESEPGYIDSVLAEVRDRNAVAAGELSEPGEIAMTLDGWGSWKAGHLALEWLFRVGEIGIRRRGNFEKAYSPIEDIVPASVLAAPTPEANDALRELTLRAVRALGVGTAHDIADYFREPSRDVRRHLHDLIETGEVVEAVVAGWSQPAFADPHAKVPRRVTGQTVLSPFDPVVWHRDRAERLFDFEYRIEIYVPAAKRRWGYYVLPVLVDGEIVARLDVKTDRADGVLRIRSAHAETGRDTPEVADRVGGAVRDLSLLVGVDDIDVEPKGDLAPLLAAAVRT